MIEVNTEPLSRFLSRTGNLYFPPEDKELNLDGWNKVCEFFKEDRNDNLKVQHLLTALRKDGKFRIPVMISEPDEYDYERNAQYKNSDHVVGNGTHRVVAHILLAEETGNPDLPIEFYEWREGESWHKEENFNYYETKIELPAERFHENEIYDLMEILHLSAPTSNDDWLEVELVSAKDREHVLLFWGNPKDNSFAVEEVHELIYETLEFNEVIENRDEVKITTVEENI